MEGEYPIGTEDDIVTSWLSPASRDEMFDGENDIPRSEHSFDSHVRLMADISVLPVDVRLMLVDPVCPCWTDRSFVSSSISRIGFCATVIGIFLIFWPWVLSGFIQFALIEIV